MLTALAAAAGARRGKRPGSLTTEVSRGAKRARRAAPVQVSYDLIADLPDMSEGDSEPASDCDPSVRGLPPLPPGYAVLLNSRAYTVTCHVVFDTHQLPSSSDACRHFRPRFSLLRTVTAQIVVLPSLL